VQAYRNVNDCMQKHDNSLIGQRLDEILSLLTAKLPRREQQDVHEWLGALLDGLEADLLVSLQRYICDQMPSSRRSGRRTVPAFI
jgi:ubiquitin C-terminal hydrolase